MKWWDKNFKILQKNHPNIAKIVESAEEGLCFTEVSAKNGDLVVKVKTSSGERNLHSLYNPKEEAERFIGSFNLNKGTVPLVVGFGLGYHVWELLKHEKNFPAIYVFELRPQLLKKSFEMFDQKKLLKNKKLRLIVNSDPNELMKAFYKVVKEVLENKEKQLIIHQPSLQLYKEEASEFVDILQKVRIVPKFQEMLKENFLSNLPIILKSPGIKNFFNKFDNIPVFLVSAGPTLKRDIEGLKKVKDKGIIISVSTVFSILLENGIRPDFIAIGDPKEVMITHFQDNLNSDVPLIYIPTASKKVIHDYQGPKIVALQTKFSFSDFVSDRIDKGRVEVGESVSTLILDVAIRMGANPIIMIGQDLAFTDGHTHVEGVQKRLKIEQAQLSIEGVDGKILTTSPVLQWILHWIEKRIEKENSKIFINVSQTGAKIKGTIDMSLDEAIDKYCKESISKDLILRTSLVSLITQRSGKDK